LISASISGSQNSAKFWLVFDLGLREAQLRTGLKKSEAAG
jgi:hypothetical protein